MISYEEALEIIREHATLCGTERVPLMESVHRVLREDVVSDTDMPPFNKSAVDGFACRKEDRINRLRVIGTVAAGSQSILEVGKNESAKIMTGAVMPRGADCVLMLEDVDGISPGFIQWKGKDAAINVCHRGEDVRVGDKLVSSGVRIAAKETASLAIAGCASPLVSKKPRVGIVATGNEIVEPSATPGPSQIRNSNSYQLLSHATDFGCISTYYGISRDTNDEIRRVILQSKQENDLTLLTGGVSAGELDLVPPLLESSGYRILFHGVSIQPGRPTVFAQADKKFVFGIPGNPVASFIVFETLVKEFLARTMGLTRFQRTVKCILARAILRQKTKRLGWRPVKLTSEGTAIPVEYHGTAHISAYAQADGILPIPVGISEIADGSVVDIRLI